MECSAGRSRMAPDNLQHWVRFARRWPIKDLWSRLDFDAYVATLSPDDIDAMAKFYTAALSGGDRARLVEWFESTAHTIPMDPDERLIRNFMSVLARLGSKRQAPFNKQVFAPGSLP